MRTAEDREPDIRIQTEMIH